MRPPHRLPPNHVLLTNRHTPGGLTIRLDLLRQNLILSIIAALLGVLTPIALSFAPFYAGFHHSAFLTSSEVLA